MEGYTDRDHALGIVVQILQHHLTHRIHLAPVFAHRVGIPAPCPSLVRLQHILLLPTQKPSLLLQPPQQTPHLPRNLSIRRPIHNSLVNDKCEVENVLIPAILPLTHAHRVPNDAMMVRTEGDEAVAELLRGDDIRRDGVEVEQRRSKRGGRCRRRYASLGDLVQDSGTWNTLVLSTPSR